MKGSFLNYFQKIWKNAVQFTNSILNVHQENGLDVMMCRDQKDYASIIY